MEKMKKLKLGIIGISEGNGHPFSWSAIFNGYNSVAMEGCGFPVIPRYLEKQTWPLDQIASASVTHVWTQQLSISQLISRACYIDKIVTKPTDMIGEIDGLLLARDDAENHLKLVKPFLSAGIPVYIDKPIALNLSDLDTLYSLQQYPGQIFSCSALKYSENFKLDIKTLDDLGKIKEIHAITPKSWAKYSPHIIEPVLSVLGNKLSSKKILERRCSCSQKSGQSLSILYENQILVRLFALGDVNCPISVSLFGTKNSITLHPNDTFQSFKSALEAFIDGIKTKTIKSTYEHHKKVVELIESGFFKNE